MSTTGSLYNHFEYLEIHIDNPPHDFKSCKRHHQYVFTICILCLFDERKVIEYF